MQIINKTPNEIIDIIRQKHREIDAVLALSNSVKQQYKGTVQDYQAACLYALAKPYNNKEARILEIGTGLGFSTSFLAQACPDAQIITLSVRPDESEHAKNIVQKNLGFKNVEFKAMESWKYYNVRENTEYFDFVFVDGDHAKVQRDLVWYNDLHQDGLILFHDYCPEFAKNPQPHVYATLNAWKDNLQKDNFDVLITDNFHIGMCGIYKK